MVTVMPMVPMIRAPLIGLQDTDAKRADDADKHEDGNAGEAHFLFPAMADIGTGSRTW